MCISFCEAAERDAAMQKKRYPVLDDLRGLTLISMIGFHAVWDIVYIFGVNWKWFYSVGAYIWQQSICWTFILLSGFCWSLGKRKLRRGIIVLLAGFAVSFVTELFMPQQRVKFGVLTLLACCMLLLIPLEKMLKRLPAVAGLAAAIACFVITRNVNEGYLGFEGINIIKLPVELYHMGDMFTFIGFTDVGFYSTDYFSLMPWCFLFITGYYIYRLTEENGLLEKAGEWSLLPRVFGYIGKQSLIIYLLHQPIVYLGLSIIFKIFD